LIAQYRILPLMLVGLAWVATAAANPLSAAARARLAAGETLRVVVELRGEDADAAAAAERGRRRLKRDDAAITALRARYYAQMKSAVEAAAADADGRRERDFSSLPMSVWNISSLAALRRMEANPAVRVVHEDILVRANSVSDLGFINQPQAAAAGTTGVGTTIAVIDGGLGTNYLNYPDFGACTAVNTPASTCRVVYNRDYYPGASGQIAHGTNVAAITLGVAPGARLAMYDVFSGSTANSSDVIDAVNRIVQSGATYNTVTVNMSFGDGGSYASQCSNSVFAAPVQSLSNVGIISVAAAGNSGSKQGLSDPACVPGVVSVGAVYEANHGTLNWGICTDTSAADRVTCFSQSATYLTLLAPGSFVQAPDASFTLSGTSQAAPHVAGAVAALRSRYPAEAASQTIQRLQYSPVHDADGSIVTPRLDLLAATTAGTAVTLSGSGPTQATAGATATYTLTVTNSGPLTATGIAVTDQLPLGATVISASSGCSVSSGVVTCRFASLAASTMVTFTITVRWSASGPVYDTASVALDQINSAAPWQQQLAFGTPSGSDDAVADAPLPLWSYALLAAALFYSGVGRRIAYG
jgi:uncharacterized repeat protein (TIGR01451 family)